MKTILCVKVTPENKDGLKKLSEMHNRSVSSIVNLTISDLLKYHKIEEIQDETAR